MTRRRREGRRRVTKAEARRRVGWALRESTDSLGQPAPVRVPALARATGLHPATVRSHCRALVRKKLAVAAKVPHYYTDDTGARRVRPDRAYVWAGSFK